MPEIRKITKNSNGTIFKYIQGVSILSEYQELWKQKRGGSKFRSQKQWDESLLEAQSLILPLGRNSKLVILACLYWGVGNKRELNLINSDPTLIKTFVNCLIEIGVKKDMLKVTLRLYEDLNINNAIKYWADILEIKKEAISSVNILKGLKRGKLKYGMCRVRVAKSARYFKLIMSMISLLRKV